MCKCGGSCEWRTIEEAKNYEVSSKGDVSNKKTGRILKPYDNGNGYVKVSLWVNGRVLRRFPHRLVATCFIPNIDELPQVNHLDEDKQHNCFENLEWCTEKENVNYGTRTKRMLETKRKAVA